MSTPLEEFLHQLRELPDEGALLDFCRRRSLHGTPVVFQGNEDAYYSFRKRIADKFRVNFHEVFITGSAKLGFSPYKRKIFDLESDIDVALISPALFEEIMAYIQDYQMELRENRRAVTADEIRSYHRFLEYGAIGWMRPDLLPTSFRVSELKSNWFSFFDSISHGRCEVGNYKVTAGAFKSYGHLERYTLSGLRSLRTNLQIGTIDVTAN